MVDMYLNQDRCCNYHLNTWRADEAGLGGQTIKKYRMTAPKVSEINKMLAKFKGHPDDVPGEVERILEEK